MDPILTRKTTYRVRLIGRSLTYSISPLFQQAAIDFYSLPIAYELCEVPLEGLAEAVRDLRGDTCLGANVTIPYKEAVVEWMDELTDESSRTGAVNTVINYKGRLTGDNTDVPGFLRALDEARFDAFEKRAVVMGAGGAARAVVAALADAEAASITIANRNLARARGLAAAMADYLDEGVLRVVEMDDAALEATLAEADLLVNATPVGTAGRQANEDLPVNLTHLPNHALVFDLVYNPPRTRLLREAENRGLQTMNGLAMLVYQGALSFEAWTGKKAPVGLMMQRARAALGQRG